MICVLLRSESISWRRTSTSAESAELGSAMWQMVDVGRSVIGRCHEGRLVVWPSNEDVLLACGRSRELSIAMNEPT